MEISASTRTPSTRLTEAFNAVRELDLAADAESTRREALAVAEIVSGLDADDDVVVAAVLAPLIDAELIDRVAAAKRFGESAVRLARALSQLGHFGLPSDWTPDKGLQSAQAEALRKMLVAVIGDVRLVVVKLAEQLQRLRSAKGADAAAKRKLAVETREVYAPLANRLGVWQVKWELEDLAFRYLQPNEYRHIAAALKTRRSERERYIEELKSQLQGELRSAGIEPRIEGRPKHIYSIWRKMQAKGLEFDQLMDIRAATYWSTAWPSVTRRSASCIRCGSSSPANRRLHRHPEGQSLSLDPHRRDRARAQPVEIQIRTHEMHANSERGVAAHWRYKEGGRGDAAYERKINELRQLLAPDGSKDSRDFLDRMRVDLFQDRVYVISPKGEIVDAPVGGTPLDFAYQVHTDLGHRTRGAKVNGRIVALDYQLQNSETVEIITAKTPQPSRGIGSRRSRVFSQVPATATRFALGFARKMRCRTRPRAAPCSIVRFNGWE